MSARLRTAFFSALLVLAVAYPILGLKLETVGVNLEVHGATPRTLWIVALAAVLMFVWQLVRDPLTAGWRNRGGLQLPVTGLGTKLTEPKTQRWVILALVLVALAWPFYGSRGAVDIATLILIYVMLGLGLNIVVGLAGLLDLGYVGFYAVGAYTYAMLSHYYGLGFWVCLPLAGLMAALVRFWLGFPVLRPCARYPAIVSLGIRRSVPHSC